MTSRHFFVVVHPSIHPPCGFLQESSRADDGDFYLFEVSANRRLYIVCRDRKIGADGRGKPVSQWRVVNIAKETCSRSYTDHRKESRSGPLTAI